VSWATFWPKAKENQGSSSGIVWRIYHFIRRMGSFAAAAVLFGAGCGALYSDVTHQVHGRPATATLMAHIKQCTVEYLSNREPLRKEQLPCEQAEELQRRPGPNRVKIHRAYIARVTFSLADGRAYEANVDDDRLGSYRLAIGATLPIVYAPDNPADVRARMSWETAELPLFAIAVGGALLVLLLRRPLTALFGRGDRFRTARTGDEPAPSERPAPALNRVS
jgi:hypothetical protein